MDRLTILEAQQQLLELPQKLTAQPIIITQDGQPVMAAVSYEQFASLLETLDILADNEFTGQLQASISQAEQGETMSWDEAKQRLGL
ncbi:MAG: type II toxin-antitoxin system Phd/YefM family antitoxin [Elainellaceae cyanobacterium]